MSKTTSHKLVFTITIFMDFLMRPFMSVSDFFME